MGRIGLTGSGVRCVRSLTLVHLSQPGASHTFAEPALLNKIPLEPADLPVQKEVALAELDRRQYSRLLQAAGFHQIPDIRVTQIGLGEIGTARTRRKSQ